MRKLRLVYILGNVGVAASLISLFFFAVPGLIFTWLFAQPGIVTSASLSNLQNVNSGIASIPYVRFVTGSLFSVLLVGWVITVPYLVFRLFGVSLTWFVINGRIALNDFRKLRSRQVS